jgi:ferredoxin
MKHQYLRNVVTLELNEEKCMGCGMCLDVCPHEVLMRSGRTVCVRDRDACMECGACAANCSFKAIMVNAGVGCAAALFKSSITGGEPTCGCGENCC